MRGQIQTPVFDTSLARLVHLDRDVLILVNSVKSGSGLQCFTSVMLLLKLEEAKRLEDEIMKMFGFPEVPIGGTPLSSLRPPILLFPHKIEVTPHTGKRFGGGG